MCVIFVKSIYSRRFVFSSYVTRNRLPFILISGNLVPDSYWTEFIFLKVTIYFDGENLDENHKYLINDFDVHALITSKTFTVHGS